MNVRIRLLALGLAVMGLGVAAIGQTTNIRPYVSVSFVPNHADWNYRLGETVEVEVAVCRSYVPLQDIDVLYEWGMEMNTPEIKKTINTGSTTGRVTLRLPGSKVPGFKTLKCTAKVDDHTYTNFIKLGFEPDKIQPSTQLPADFKEFWDRAVADARKVALEPRLTLQPDLCTSKYDVYMIRYQHNRPGCYIYGMLTVPKKEGVFPAIVKVPGAGVRAYEGEKGWLPEQDVVTLQVGIHGFPVNLPDEVYADLRNNALKYYMLQQNDDRDRYYYKQVYTGCVRAYDFLAQLPMVDENRIAVYGGSQGGLLSLVVAALEPRIKCVSTYFPAMAEIAGHYHGRAEGWPHLFMSDREVNVEQKVKVSEYYDAVNFARFVRQPMLFFTGYNDQTCCPTSTLSVYNVLNCPKQLVIPLDCGHWLYPEQVQQQREWLMEQLQ